MSERAPDAVIEDQDIDRKASHFYHDTVEGGIAKVALCGLDMMSDEHIQSGCGGARVDFRQTAYCPRCGAPVCAYCRLIAEGMPSA